MFAADAQAVDAMPCKPSEELCPLKIAERVMVSEARASERDGVLS